MFHEKWVRTSTMYSTSNLGF